ncbi:MAG TPA: beta-ketoacyl reductase, partial [Thermoleophilaceae bacterium]
GARADGTWLVLRDRGEVATELVAAIEARGGRALLVDDDIASPEVARTLIASAESPLRGVVHLRGLDSPEMPAGGLAELRDATRRDCGALLHVVQALAAAEKPQPQLWLATRGVQPAGGAAPAPLHAPLWGLGRVVALEHSELWGGMVDLDPAGMPGEAALLLDEILASDGEDQVAHRRGERYAARLVPGALDAGRGVLLRPDASYLVAGGRGALGLKLAAWMADRGARHLILTGRGPVTREAAAAVARLEERGVSVDCPRADVADPDAMAAVLDAVEPPVRGVVHAAGVFEPRRAADMSRAEFEEVAAAKIEGTWVLHELTRATELDFFVMFSSAASVWGSALAGHYVAGNHFQDVAAHHRRGLGLPALAVNWGWWEGSDMVPEEAKAYFGALGLEVVPEDAGFDALERLLESKAVQRTIAPVDWRTFKAAFSARRRRPLLDLIEVPVEPGGAASAEGLELIRALEQAPARRRGELIVDFLQRLVGAALGLDRPMDPQLGFFDAGMDSITAVEVKTRIESSLGVAIPATAAFEHPNIEALATYLLGDVLELAAPEPVEEKPPEANGNGHAELDGLSEDELLDLLENQLAGAER